MKNGEQPAFAQIYNEDSTRLQIIKNGGKPHGLTKREYFAAMAMQGMLANHIATEETIKRGIDPIESFPLQAVLAADELLKQLES